MPPDRRPATVARPFRALHYDPSRVSLADVVAPPYDVIDEAMHERLLARSPFNVVRLILPERGTEEAAGALLRSWTAAGIVVVEPEPCVYWLSQDYVGPDGIARSRGGLIATIRLENDGDGDGGGMRPHERTMEGPIAGRLRLMRAMRANMSPIFAIYDDPARAASAAVAEAIAVKPPVLGVRDDDGTLHRLWRVCETGPLTAALAAVAQHPAIIADGHHRYETALAYRRERRAVDGHVPEAPYDLAPVFLANLRDPGLEVFATHRVVVSIERDLHASIEARLAGAFTLRPTVGDADALLAALQAQPHGRPAVALWPGSGRPGQLAVLADEEMLSRALPDASPATRALDVSAAAALVLHDILGLSGEGVAATDRIRYLRTAAAAAAAVEAEPPGSALAVLVRAPTMADIEAVVDAGETMPPKSTYFYPKVLDGMVFHGLDVS